MFDDIIMPFLEGLEHHADEALVAVERFLGRHLRDGGRIGRALGLDIGHRLDEPCRTRGVADPPAGHRVGLGNPVQYHGAVVQVRIGVEDVDKAARRPNDVLVHVIGRDDDVGMLA